MLGYLEMCLITDGADNRVRVPKKTRVEMYRAMADWLQCEEIGLCKETREVVWRKAQDRICVSIGNFYRERERSVLISRAHVSIDADEDRQDQPASRREKEEKKAVKVVAFESEPTDPE